MAKKFNIEVPEISKEMQKVIGFVLALIILIIVIVLVRKALKKPTVPDINPNLTANESAQLQNLYNGATSSLPHEQIYYKERADAIQNYMQTNVFDWVTPSHFYDNYFNDLVPAEFTALSYFWAKRDYSPNWSTDPFHLRGNTGTGTLTESLKARADDSDYQKIANAFSSTGLI